MREARAVAAAANLVTAPGDVLQRFHGAENGLPTVGEVAARRVGGAPRTFPSEGAWIDFRGPPGTIPSVSFADLLSGSADTSRLRDRVVVVGATAPTLGDVHPTPTANHELMSGAEVQANAIWTALHGLPLRDAPSWVGWLAIAVMGLAPALAAVRGRALRGALVAPLLGLVWLITVQACFQRGIILPVSYPLIALVLGTVTATTSAFVLEREQRRRTSLYSEQLEHEVAARTEEVRETQLEVVLRLSRAVESRDADTGEHVDRMSALSERLALAVGMPAGRGGAAPPRIRAARRRQARHPRPRAAQARPLRRATSAR